MLMNPSAPKLRPAWTSRLSTIAIAGFMLLAAGCASTERLPAVPASETSNALPLGLPNARFYPSQRSEIIAEGQHAVERQRQTLGIGPDTPLPAAQFLAISGGGDDGAFGSGLLVGWTEAGTRPNFDIVTGVSTGALLAPFAFLGRDYDEQLRQVYTTVSSDDIFINRGLIAGVFSDALSNTTPLWNFISRFVDSRMVEAIAREYQKGRLLLIGTTDLDAQRPSIWNIGAIAASGHTASLDLIRKILRASSAIPGVFQPVMIDVLVNGAHFQELHVDGGAIAQMFLYPPNISLSRFTTRERNAFLIRNAREDPEWKNVEKRTLGINGRAISTMLRASGANDLVRIYFVTQRDGVKYNLAYIDTNFSMKHPEENFDKSYMNALFNYAYEQAKRGYSWRNIPPILSEQ